MKLFSKRNLIFVRAFSFMIVAVVSLVRIYKSQKKQTPEMSLSAIWGRLKKDLYICKRTYIQVSFADLLCGYIRLF